MTECPNAEIRDRLPDLVHERLDAVDRNMVLVHLRSCAACRSELLLLRQLRAVLTAGPKVDIAHVVRVLPSPSALPAMGTPSSHRTGTWGARWRVAAGIAVLLLGGAGVWSYHARGHVAASRVAAVDSATPSLSLANDVRGRAIAGAAVSIAKAGTAPEVRVAQPGATAKVPQAAELAMADGFSDMSVEQMRLLLTDLDGVEALPPADPDPIVVRVSAGGSGSQ